MRYVLLLIGLVGCSAVDEAEPVAPPNRPAWCESVPEFARMLRRCVADAQPADDFTRDGCFVEAAAICGH